MAQKTEKLPQEIVDSLKAMQTKSNETIIGLGQIHLRIKSINIELQKLQNEQALLEQGFFLNEEEFTKIVKNLEKTYPTGEVDLNEGVVIFEAAE